MYMVENAVTIPRQFPVLKERLTGDISMLNHNGAIDIGSFRDFNEQIVSQKYHSVNIDRVNGKIVLNKRDEKGVTYQKLEKAGQFESNKYIFRDLLRRPRVSKDGHEKHKRNVTTAKNDVLLTLGKSNMSRKAQFLNETRPEEINLLDKREGTKTLKVNGKEKLILFYNPSNYQIVRNLTNITYTFDSCQYKNCKMSFNPNEAKVSDAVIFHWFKQLKHYPNYTRPRNQVWIFIQHEPTRQYVRNSTVWPFWAPGMRNNFNWTMTYSRYSDIQLPYGMMKLKPSSSKPRDYLAIAKSKTRDAVWIVSKCPTSGRREEYLNILKKYIDVDVLGACGRNWSCGVRSNHPLNNCFDILNTTYRYYLAFENDLCDDYVSEKFYENYEYDLLMVSRAGHPNRRPVEYIDKDAYIDTKDFKNPHELGKYMQSLSKNVTRYAEMLATKDNYGVVTYQELFLKSVCNICERLNNLKKYRFVYEDVSKWLRQREPCYGVRDLVNPSTIVSSKQKSKTNVTPPV